MNWLGLLALIKIWGSQRSENVMNIRKYKTHITTLIGSNMRVVFKSEML